MVEESEEQMGNQQDEELHILTVFADYSRARCEAWAAEERSALASFMDECREAWEWIQVSYCLKHGDDSVVSNAGYGCSWAAGAGYGNAGFMKGVAVEEHHDILSYGQEDYMIKHIEDVEGLVQGAVDWVLEGVEEQQATLLTEANTAADMAIQELEEAKAALDESLTNQVNSAE
jgi:hypothetical protein